MKSEEIIKYIHDSKKRTPVKVYLKEKEPIEFHDVKSFGVDSKVIFGEWNDIGPVLDHNKDKIEEIVIENNCRNSGIPLLDLKGLNARIEPGAWIREQVKIEQNVVVMMGAIINIGCVIKEGTMIDMGAVLGARVIVGKHCHIGAGAVLAGVVEPPSAQSVIVEDNVLIGANSVVIEGVHIAKGAVIAAGSIVIDDVKEDEVVAGVPARVIKKKDKKTECKTEIIEALREL